MSAESNRPENPEAPEASERASDDPQTPEEIRAEIERTQQELGDTVEALAHKTDVKAQASARIDAAADTVREAVNDVKGSVHETADQAAAKLRQATPESASAGAQQVSATVQDKPLPFAAGGAFIAGLLIGWLFGRR